MSKTRIATKYPGVYYRLARRLGKKNEEEKVFYVTFKQNGKKIEEKAGRQYSNKMTEFKANAYRTRRIEGKEVSPKEKKQLEKAKQQEKANTWTINRLWDEYKKNNPSLKGIVTDENRFQNYLNDTFGNKEPKEIISLDVDRIRIGLLKKKSPGTVKNILELLRRIINFGVKKNLCDGINFIIEMPDVNNIKTEDLLPDQLLALLTAIEEDANIMAANIMKLALYTGMRRGELFKLQWSDIDYHRGFILIRDPKGGIDQKIPLNDTARRILINHPKTESLYVFPGRDGNQRTDIKKSVNRIRDRAGLPKDFRPLHGLRHVYASMLASSGQVDMYTLQKLLTHKSPSMTQRYAHLRDDSLKKASELACKIINNI